MDQIVTAAGTAIPLIAPAISWTYRQIKKSIWEKQDALDPRYTPVKMLFLSEMYDTSFSLNFQVPKNNISELSPISSSSNEWPEGSIRLGENFSKTPAYFFSVQGDFFILNENTINKDVKDFIVLAQEILITPTKIILSVYNENPVPMISTGFDLKYDNFDSTSNTFRYCQINAKFKLINFNKPELPPPLILG